MDNDDADLVLPTLAQNTLVTREAIDKQVKEVLDDPRIPPPRYVTHYGYKAN